MDQYLKKCIKLLNLIKKLGENHILYEVRSKKKTKNDFKKDFLNLMNKEVFGTIMEI